MKNYTIKIGKLIDCTEKALNVVDPATGKMTKGFMDCTVIPITVIKGKAKNRMYLSLWWNQIAECPSKEAVIDLLHFQLVDIFRQFDERK